MKDINIGEWKIRLLKENTEVDPAKDHFAKAEDNLYKKVTGEEPKASNANKFRDVKEGSGQDEYDRIPKELKEKFLEIAAYKALSLDEIDRPPFLKCMMEAYNLGKNG